MKNNDNTACPRAAKDDARGRQATAKQFVMIVFILALATKLFLLPVFLIRTAGRDGYILLAIGGGVDLVSLGTLLAAMKLSPDKDFFTLLSETFGRTAARITAASIGLYLFFKLNVAAAETLYFYSDNVFSDPNTVLMTGVLTIFLAAVGSHTLRALARLNELIVPVVLVSIVTLVTIVAFTGFDLANIFPALYGGKSLGGAAVRNASWLGDFTPLVLFIGRTENKRHTGFIAAAGGTIGIAVAVFFALVMCAAFGNVPTLADSSTNLSNILQYSLGNVYGRIDLVTSVLWSVAAFIETALFFYSACRCFAFAIGRNAHFAVSVCVCAALLLVQVLAMTDPTVFAAVVQSEAAGWISLSFTLAVPALAVVCASARGKRIDGIPDGARHEERAEGGAA